jgi:hypothetical protein
MTEQSDIAALSGSRTVGEGGEVKEDMASRNQPCGAEKEPLPPISKPSAPVRVRLSRAKGWRMPPNTVKVDRSTRWGNPFSMGDAIDLGMTSLAAAPSFLVECFRSWLPNSPRANDLWMGPESDAARQHFIYLSQLRGKNLACWCALDAPCHADVLLELANAPTAADTTRTT